MKYTQGFIALASVLVLSAIFLSISISIASRAISGSDTSIGMHEREVARFIVMACVEHALVELQRTLNYDGEESILVGDTPCEIESIGGDGNTNRTIHAESQVGSVVYRVVVDVAVVSPHLSITSYERVASF